MIPCNFLLLVLAVFFGANALSYLIAIGEEMRYPSLSGRLERQYRRQVWVNVLAFSVTVFLYLFEG